MSKAKLIIVGEATVGKTSILLQYNENNFQENYLTTIGNDKIIKDFTINGKKVRIDIWDTAGQEKYRAVNKIFMKNTQIALIVYSITDKNSYEQLSFWINQVKEVNKDKQIIFGIAANKSDLFEQQVIDTEKGKKFADDNNCLFFETSAKDHGSIVNVFDKLVEKYVENNNNEKDEVQNLQSQNNNNQIIDNDNIFIESAETDNLNDVEKPRKDCSCSKC